MGTRSSASAPLLALAFVLAATACQRNAPDAAKPAAGTEAPAPVAVELKDVTEQDPRYIVGISYPAMANQYPGLATELRNYADAARGELMQAVEGLGTGKPTAPYDLSLSFSEVARTPRLVAVAADGSTYTGGAHGNPLIARFVWLPEQQQMLTSAALVPDAKNWVAISDYAREQLHTALSQRLDSEDVDAADRAEMLQNASKMIDAGTDPDPANFAQFEPVLTADGRIGALRFVFPPYQVGPYADGTQSVDIPAGVLLPSVAPAYRSLFADG